MPNIFVFHNGNQKSTGAPFYDVISEDGVFLSQEVFESKEVAHDALGVTTLNRHDLYRRYYPDGFTVVAVDDPETHEGFKAAIALHRGMTVEEYGVKIGRVM